MVSAAGVQLRGVGGGGYNPCPFCETFNVRHDLMNAHFDFFQDNFCGVHASINHIQP